MGIGFNILNFSVLFLIASLLVSSYQEAEAGGFAVPEDINIDSIDGGECSQIGNWDQNSLTCTLNADVFNVSIKLLSDNLTLDGNGNRIFGSEFTCFEFDEYHGIDARNVSGLTIKNIIINDYGTGIFWFNVDNSDISQVESEFNCFHGLDLQVGSDDNIINNSIFSNNGDDNVILRQSNGNEFTDIEANFSADDDGIDLEDSDNNIFTKVKANFNDDEGLDMEDFTSNGNGSDGNSFIESEFRQNESSGIELELSNNNSFRNNEVSLNLGHGIEVRNSDDNDFIGNSILQNGSGGNNEEGIKLFEGSDRNEFRLNLVSENQEEGLDIEDDSSDNIISCNDLINNRRGVEFEDSGAGNVVTGNTFNSNNDVAIEFDESIGNEIFLNNFLNQPDLLRFENGVDEDDNDVHDNYFENSEVFGTTINNQIECNELGEVIEIEQEPISNIQCDVPEETPTEVEVDGENITFTVDGTCDVTRGDSVDESIPVEIIVDKNVPGLIIPDQDAVNLDLWEEESFGASSWVVQEGTSVVQTINGEPTFFHSPFNAFNSQFGGKIIVETSGDDDFIGFALGFQPGDTENPDANYLLIDWKQSDQNFNWGGNNSPGGNAQAGLAVSRINGIPDFDELWQHEDLDPNNDGGVTELARGITLGNTGWDDNTEYEFEFVFTQNNLKVFVDGNLEIDIDGDFSDGRFAFYNFSQGQVRYSGFNLIPLLDESATITITFPDESGVITINEEGTIIIEPEGPTFTIEGISIGTQGTGDYTNPPQCGDLSFVAIDNNDSASGNINLNQCPAEPQPEPQDDNDGGDNQWDTRPTFGVNHEDRSTQIVENGFQFNDQSFTVTDNHHTDFARQTINVGETNSFAATVYASKGLWIQEFLFGVPDVGQGHLAEVGIEVRYDNNGEIEEVKVVQETNVIDPETLRVSHQKSLCLSTDSEPKCDTTRVSMKFMEPLMHDVTIIKAIDQYRRDQSTSLNEGFDISGKSLNPMPTEMIPSPTKGEGLIKVTQHEKYSDYWIAQDGRIFEKNSFGSFTQIDQKFERFQDKGEPRTRLHSGFGGIIDQEKIRASELFDSSSIISELPPSFAYEFPETRERIDEKMRQEMIIQEHIAQKLLENVSNQARFH